MDDLTARVIAEAREALRRRGKCIDAVEPTDTLDALGLTSLDVVDLCMDLEDSLGIRIPDEAITTTMSVSALTARVEAAVGHRERVGTRRAT